MRVLESLLFEITPTDPTTFGIVTAFFLALAIRHLTFHRPKAAFRSLR